MYGFEPLDGPDTVAAARAILDALTFTPVPVRPRADGWTPAKQAAFVGWLRDLGSVKDAAAMVGMTPKGAYTLRQRAGAASFASAWDAALRGAGETLMQRACRRAVNGEPVAIVRHGRVVGATLKYDTSLLIALLRRHDGYRPHRRARL